MVCAERRLPLLPRVAILKTQVGQFYATRVGQFYVTISTRPGSSHAGNLERLRSGFR